MTTIVWRNHRVYSDSAVIKGTERYQSLTKIHQLRNPLKMTSDVPEHRDTILGWVACGAMDAAAGFVGMLIAKPKLSFVVTIYEMIGKQNLITLENYFEVILIGTKANYAIAPSPDSCEVKIYRHDQCFGLGTGGKIAADLIMDGGYQPIRAMYGAMYQDRLSGGMVDVWELTKGKNPVFKRIGLCNEVPYENIPDILTKPTKPYPLDLVDQCMMLNNLPKGVRQGKSAAKSTTKPKTSPIHKGKKS